MTDDKRDLESAGVERPEGEARARNVVWERWAEVDALLERALEVEPEARGAFVRATAPNDPELIEAVLDLALVDSTSDPGWTPGEHVLRAAVLDRPDMEMDAPESLLGARVGAYRLERVLGSGGMGSVYAADRIDESFERRVAVKVLKRAVATADVVARFRLERQILASLNHPSIAQLIDGGVTDDARPYLVMELVDGLRIDEWADRRRLGIEERVRLVVDVMEAVEHAHRHLVVHRDLKPSNILVRDDGTAKLLDFGIAKLVDDSDEEGQETRTGRRFVTPEYAAPEQLLGESASTQTDVYSLGVLLYELLTGTRPYQRDGNGTILEQVVEGGEPTAPSAAVPPGNTRGSVEPRGLGPDSVYSARGTTPSALRKRLRGDLDAILVRALRARPSERYANVSAFREDLERHLNGRPVRARGDARGYRLRTFVRRHRWAVSGTAAASLLITGSAIGLAFQRGSLIEQRRIAEDARDRAASEAETARATTDFLVDLFRASDPSERMGDTLTARALLERGAERLEVGLREQPEVRADLLGTLGQVHVALGRFDEGVELQERALRLAEELDLPDRVRVERLMGLADAYDQRHEYEASADGYREAAALARELADTASIAESLIRLGSALSRLDRPDEAEIQVRAGLALAAAASGVGANAWGGERVLAGILRRQGDYEGADSLLTGIVERGRIGGGSPSGFMRDLNDLAVVRRYRERYDEAVALYEEAVDSATTVLGPAHPEALMFRSNQASALILAGRHDDAVDAYVTAVEVARAEWPDGHWRTANLLSELGGTLIGAGRAEEALRPLAEAVDMAMVEIGPYHAWTNVYRGWLGAAARLTERDEAADQLFGWSLEGLGSYPDFASDRNTIERVESLVRTMHEVGLSEDVSPFEDLLASASSGS